MGNERLLEVCVGSDNLCNASLCQTHPTPLWEHTAEQWSHDSECESRVNCRYAD